MSWLSVPPIVQAVVVIMAVDVMASGCGGRRDVVSISQSDSAVKTERQRLEGRWAVVSWVKDGEELGAVGMPEYVLSNARVSHYVDGCLVGQFDYKLNPNASPKQIDWGSVAGIYRLEDPDTLVVLMVARSNARPVAFDPPSLDSHSVAFA